MNLISEVNDVDKWEQEQLEMITQTKLQSKQMHY